jgi:MFS family permease
MEEQTVAVAEAQESTWSTLRRLPAPAWILTVGAFINQAGGFVSVFLALYIKDLGYSAATSGAMVGTYFGGRAVAGLLGGQLTDRLGYRTTIVVSMVSGAAIACGFLISQNILYMFTLTTLFGISSQLYRPASAALLADIVGEKDRTTVFGLYNLALYLGLAVLGIAGGLLASESFTLVFIGDAATALIFAVIAFRFLPAGKVVGQHDTEVNKGESLIRVIASDHRFTLVLISGFLIYLACAQWYSGLPLQVSADHHSTTFYGVLWMVNGIALIVVQFPILALVQRVSKVRALGIAYLITGVGFLLVGLSSSSITLILASIILTFAEAIFIPVLLSYTAELAPANYEGRYQGAAFTSFQLGFFVGGYLGGALFSLSSLTLWLFVFVTCAAAMIIVMLSGVARGRTGYAR